MSNPNDIASDSAPMKRCLTCFYVLENLPEDRCPECGRLFDPLNSTTYSTKPPFIWWRFWLPGCTLAFAMGIAAYFLLIPMTGFGWAVGFAIPCMIGGVVGYATQVRFWIMPLLGILVVLACMLGLGFGGFGGVICALILLAMALVPLLLSIFAGFFLRILLKGSSWQQRRWLPLLFIAFPLAVGALENWLLPPAPMVTVQTSQTLDAPLGVAWDSVVYYEDVKHDPPWLLRLTLRRPLYATGSADHVGARKTCVYTRGRLTKEVTAVEPLKSVTFSVVEQHKFEDYSMRLIDGGFNFESIDATHTKVTLTTRYRPLLHPRTLWQPAEEHLVHLLHQHVLRGMNDKAIDDRRDPQIRIAQGEDQ